MYALDLDTFVDWLTSLKTEIYFQNFPPDSSTLPDFGDLIGIGHILYVIKESDKHHEDQNYPYFIYRADIYDARGQYVGYIGCAERFVAVPDIWGVQRSKWVNKEQYIFTTERDL